VKGVKAQEYAVKVANRFAAFGGYYRKTYPLRNCGRKPRKFCWM